MRARAIRWLALALLCLLVSSTGAVAQSVEVAIVVHPSAPVRGLTLDDLRRVFLAERQFWRDGSRITLLVRAPHAPERSVVLARVFRMTEDEYRQYWVGKMLRAEVASGPQVVFSARMAQELVAEIRGAITFVPASEVDTDTRVLRIDGKLPGEAGYPL